MMKNNNIDFCFLTASAVRSGIEQVVDQFKNSNKQYRGLSNSDFMNKQIQSLMNKKLNTAIWKHTLIGVSFLILMMLHAQAQDSLQVTGRVISGNSTPIPNVAVSVEGSREMPVITSESGEFTVKTTSGSDWLIISPASNFKKKRVFIASRTNLDIVLSSSDIVSGDDELTLFSQQIPMKNIVSSYSSIDVNEIRTSTALSIDQFMQGRAKGLHMVNLSGTPGSGTSAMLRGVNSLNGNTQPLYVVDGIPMETQGIFGSVIDGYSYNPLSNINLFDVSNVTVMNDPVYSAAYGSKASNGLVMIQTLDPSATETTFEVDVRRGLSLAPSNLIPQLNASQHRTLANEVLFSSGMNEEVISEKYPNLFLETTDEDYINYTHDTNWQKLIFENASSTSVNLKVKGGDEIARYGLSVGYSDNKGIIRSTDFTNFNFRFVSYVNIFKWLKLNAGVSFNNAEGMLKESGRVKETSPILASLSKSPMLNPYSYDLNGKLMTTLAEVDSLGTSNPLAIINRFEATTKNYHLIANMNFEVIFSKNLKLNVNTGLTYNAQKEKMFMPNHGMESYYNTEAHNVAKASTNTLNSVFNNTYLQYNKTINKDHFITSNTGVNVLTNQFQYDWGIAKNAHENDEYRELDDGTYNLHEVGGDNRNWNWASLYESVTYSFRDKYMASGSLSLDGSSRIGENAKNTLKLGSVPFGLFYAVGAGWRLSNESFLNQASWLEDLKLRVSYGHTGNDDIGESNATNYYRSILYRETVGIVPATFPNDELTYESVNQANVGLDVALFGNRVRANFDVFQSSISDMLIYTELDNYLGYKYRPENGGAMQNKGWEFNGFIRIVDNKSFKWDFEANISKVSNEITQINGDKIISKIEGGEIVNMKGAAANSFYGFIYEGVYRTAEEAAASMLKNDKLIAYSAGDAKYRDISGPDGKPDNIINDWDKTVIGSSMPEFYGGINNKFIYKNWSLSAFVQFVSGNDVYNYVRYCNERMTGLENQSQATLNRWQYNGQETDVPRALWNDPIGNSSFSTRWIENGSYLRLKNVSLSYSIPHEFLAFKNAEFYFSATNILTLSKYLGYDPESSISYSTRDQGVDYGTTPQPRQFMIGIKFGL